MADENESHEVTCPHCHRDFAGELLGAGEQRGYKCPHCRLFVPLERVEEEPAGEASAR